VGWGMCVCVLGGGQEKREVRIKERRKGCWKGKGYVFSVKHSSELAPAAVKKTL